MQSLEDAVKATIRDIPDFPRPGILFKDITTVLADPALLKRINDHLVERYADKNIDVIVGMESRGFLFGMPLAISLGAAFAPARKPGKLPHERVSVSYDLEYGSATLELHTDALAPRAQGAGHRRSPRHGGDGPGDGAAHRGAGRRGGGVRLPHRARVPRRPGPPPGGCSRDRHLLRVENFPARGPEFARAPQR